MKRDFLRGVAGTNLPPCMGPHNVVARTTRYCSLPEDFMKRLLGILALVLVFGLPVLAQVQRMTPDDEDAFNGYYSRWLQDRQTNNRDDMVSMEHHMQDLMGKYAIPSDTPYAQV